MIISVAQGSIQESKDDTIIVNLFEGVTKPGGATGAIDMALGGAISELIANGDLMGKTGEVAVLYPRDAIPAKRVLVAGLGKSDNFDVEDVRKAAAAAIGRARQLNATRISTIVHGGGIGDLPVAIAAQATAEGSLLALYRYSADKKEKEDEHEPQSLTIIEYDKNKIAEIDAGVRIAQAVASGVNLARDLVNMPPNVATPSKMAQTAEEIARIWIWLDHRR